LYIKGEATERRTIGTQTDTPLVMVSKEEYNRLVDLAYGLGEIKDQNLSPPDFTREEIVEVCHIMLFHLHCLYCISMLIAILIRLAFISLSLQTALPEHDLCDSRVDEAVSVVEPPTEEPPSSAEIGVRKHKRSEKPSALRVMRKILPKISPSTEKPTVSMKPPKKSSKPSAPTVSDALPVSKIQGRQGARKDNKGIRAVQSAKYLEELRPERDNFPTPGNWKPTEEHGTTYYMFLCRDYELAAGEIQVPGDASVYWSEDKTLLLPEKAGDILPGVDAVTPNARENFADFKIGGHVEFHLYQTKRDATSTRKNMDFGPVVKGTHWGDGIILTDQARIMLVILLGDVFKHPEKDLTPTLLAALLRSFWPSRTYVRLFKFGGKKGERLSEFHTRRMSAVFSKSLTIFVL
jgi:hypothetical protein